MANQTVLKHSKLPKYYIMIKFVAFFVWLCLLGLFHQKLAQHPWLKVSKVTND